MDSIRIPSGLCQGPSATHLGSIWTNIGKPWGDLSSSVMSISKRCARSVWLSNDQAHPAKGHRAFAEGCRLSFVWDWPVNCEFLERDCMTLFQSYISKCIGRQGIGSFVHRGRCGCLQTRARTWWHYSAAMAPQNCGAILCSKMSCL